MAYKTSRANISEDKPTIVKLSTSNISLITVTSVSTYHIVFNIRRIFDVNHVQICLTSFSTTSAKMFNATFAHKNMKYLLKEKIHISEDSGHILSCHYLFIMVL